MLYGAAVFLLLAIAAVMLGFDAVAGAAAGITQVLFITSLIAFALLVLLGTPPPGP